MNDLYTIPEPPKPAFDPLALLRPYQVDVVNRAAAQVGKGLRRGIIQGGTGAGKTRCAGYLARRCFDKGNRTLVIADRRRLVRQFGEALDLFRVPHGVVMAGATHSVDAPAILATSETLASWYASGMSPGTFPLVIIDEAHRSMAEVFQELLSLFPDAVQIGLTATPARADGRSLGSYWQWLECMVPESQLVTEGYLIRPEVYSPLELAGKRKRGMATRGMSGDPVSHWKRHADGLPTIAFCASIAASVELRDKFMAAGVPAEHIDASTPDDDSDDGREAAFDRLAKRKTLVLSSVGLLIEGVDIPEASAALLWKKFGSLVQYRQACGRIMRPCPGKSRAVVLDHAGAAGVHGLPGDDIPWSLEADSSVRKRLRQRGEPDPIVCPQCGAAFRAQACPACNWRPRAKDRTFGGKPPERARDELLSRYTDSGAAQESRHDMLERFWKRCIYIAVARQSKAGAAVAMFNGKFGIAPWNAGVGNVPDDRDSWKRAAADVWPWAVKVRV